MSPEAVYQSNRAILKLLIRVFRVKGVAICKATGVSRSFLSRLLHDQAFRASTSFWTRLNNALPSLIEPTVNQVFQLADNQIDNAGLSLDAH